MHDCWITNELHTGARVTKGVVHNLKCTKEIFSSAFCQSLVREKPGELGEKELLGRASASKCGGRKLGKSRWPSHQKRSSFPKQKLEELLGLIRKLGAHHYTMCHREMYRAKNNEQQNTANDKASNKKQSVRALFVSTLRENGRECWHILASRESDKNARSMIKAFNGPKEPAAVMLHSGYARAT